MTEYFEGYSYVVIRSDGKKFRFATEEEAKEYFEEEAKNKKEKENEDGRQK